MSKMLIVFDDMIADMETKKRLNLVVAELFMRGRKLNILLVFILQSYFKVPEDKAKCKALFSHENTLQKNSNK